MSTPPERVRPGDLITASFMNRLLDRLKACEDKLAVGTGTGSSLFIDSIVPSGTLSVGQQIEVHGRGFADPVSGNIVTMGGMVIERFLPGSTPSILIMTVPNIPGVPRSDVVLTVRNGTSSDSETLNVIPAVVVPVGRLMITDVTGTVAPPGTITVGGTFTFWFDLESQTLPGGETYNFSTSYANASGSTVAAWLAATVMVSSTGSPLGSSTMRLNPGSPVRIGVRFTVPTGAARVELTLVAQSVNNPSGLSTAMGPIPIVTGVAQPVSDPRVSVLMPPIEDGVANVRIAGDGTIEVNYRTNPRLTFLAEMNAGAPTMANYRFTCSLEPDPGAWALTSPSPAPTTVLPVARNSDQTIEVNARLNADPAGGSHPEARVLLVAVEQQGGDNFRSFRRFPIRGF
jgi:hypothetical protein